MSVAVRTSTTDRRLRLKDSSLLVWRAVAAAPAGVLFSRLWIALQLHFDDEAALAVRLNCMAQSGYVVCEGKPRTGIWQITAKLPLGEPRPAWQGGSDEAEQAEASAPAAPAPEPAPAPAGRWTPPPRPNSIFAVGDVQIPPAWREGVSARGETPPEAAFMHANPYAISPGAVLREVAKARPVSIAGDDASTDIDQELRETPPADGANVHAATVADGSSMSIRGIRAEPVFRRDARPAPPAPPAPSAGPSAGPPPAPRTAPQPVALTPRLSARVPAAPAKPTAPVFELHSDGILVLDIEANPATAIVVPARVTRALFRWLDCLGGTNLQRLTETEA